MFSNLCVGSWSARRLCGLSLLISKHIRNDIINFCLWNPTLQGAIECKACYVYTAYMYIYTYSDGNTHIHDTHAYIYTYIHACSLHLYYTYTCDQLFTWLWVHICNQNPSIWLEKRNLNEIDENHALRLPVISLCNTDILVYLFKSWCFKNFMSNLGIFTRRTYLQIVLYRTRHGS